MGTAASSTAIVAPAPSSVTVPAVIVAQPGAQARSEVLSSHGPAKRSALGGFTEHPVESNKKNAKDTGEGLYIFPEPARHRVLESVFEVPPTTDDIGRGHYGVVRKGFRKTDRMPVAIKTIPKKRVVYVEMLRSEVAILRALSGWSDVNSMSIPVGAEGPLDAGLVHLRKKKKTGAETVLIDGPPMAIPSHMGPGLEDQSIVDHVDLARVLAQCTALPLAGQAQASDAATSLDAGGVRVSAASGPSAVAPFLSSLRWVTGLATTLAKGGAGGGGGAARTAKVTPSTQGLDEGPAASTGQQPSQEALTRLPRWSDGSVVRLVDAFEDSKQAHLVFELCTGGELYEPIADSSYRFTEAQAARIMRQLLLAVRACHDADIVHRDLKPENILLVEPGVDCDVRIIDFGLATTCRAQDSLIRHVGTPYYIAPEILEPPYGKACDLWSCGVIAFTLLCGYPPFFGDSEKEIYGRIRRGQYRFEGPEWDRKGMKDHRSMSSREFIAALLARDPSKRLTAQQALCHPWMQWEGDVPTLPIALGLAERDRVRGAETLLRMLRAFSTQPFVKKAALRALLSAGSMSCPLEYSAHRRQGGGLRPPVPPEQAAAAEGAAPAPPAAAAEGGAAPNAGRGVAGADTGAGAGVVPPAAAAVASPAPPQAGSTAITVQPAEGATAPAAASTSEGKTRGKPSVQVRPKRSAYESLCEMLDIPLPLPLVQGAPAAPAGVAGEGGGGDAGGQGAARRGSQAQEQSAPVTLTVPSLPVYASCALSPTHAAFQPGVGAGDLAGRAAGPKESALTAAAASLASVLTKVLIGTPGSTLLATDASPSAEGSVHPPGEGGGSAHSAAGKSAQHEAQGLAFLSAACSPALSALVDSLWDGCEVMQVLPGYLPAQDGGVSWASTQALHSAVARRQTVHSSAFDLHAATAGMVGVGPRQLSLLLAARSLLPPAEVLNLLWSAGSYVQWEPAAPPAAVAAGAPSPQLTAAVAGGAAPHGATPQPAVGFYDFCAAILPRLCWLDPPCLLRAFTLLDVDGDGLISPTDLCGCPGLWAHMLQPGGSVDAASPLAAALCGRPSGDPAVEAAAQSALLAAAQAAVAECDLDGDGAIDLREFFAVMTGNERARL